MINYLIIILFTISCFKVAKEDLKNLNKSKISENLLSLFKGKDLDKLYQGLKEEVNKENKLIDIYDDNGSNLLMLTLETNFNIKDKEQLFSKILLCICAQEDILDSSELLSSSNPFVKLELHNSHKCEILKKEFEFKLDDKFKKILRNDKIQEFENIFNKFNNQRKTLIFYAFNLGEKIFIDFLINLVDLEWCDNEGTTPLVYAICERREVVKYLHTKGYLEKFTLNYNFEFKKNLSDPLIYAVMQGDKEIVNILLLNGCSVNSIDEHGNKAILLAANLNYENIVNLLIACGGKYLNKEEIVARKVKKAATKATTALVQLVSDAAFKGAGAPVSLNTASLTSLIKRGHNLNRTKLYGKVLKIFLKGNWINEERYSRNTLVKYKDLLGALKYHLNEVQENELIKTNSNTEVIKYPNKFEKMINKIQNTLLSPIKNMDDLFHLFKKKLSKIKNLPKKIESLGKDFKKIEVEFLNLNSQNFYINLQEYFVDQANNSNGTKSLNKLQITLGSLRKIRSDLSQELSEILGINKKEKDAKKEEEKKDKKKQKEKKKTEGEKGIFGHQENKERISKGRSKSFSRLRDDSSSEEELENEIIEDKKISMEVLLSFRDKLIKLLSELNKFYNDLREIEIKINKIKNSN